jgi:hypothetical protein
MTATIALTAAEITDTRLDVISAWALYRRSQLIPAGPPDLINARAALLRLLEPHTRTYSQDFPATLPDLDAIEDAADTLVAAVEWHCGTGTASFVAEGRAA